MHAQHEKGLIILLMQQLGFIFNIPWQDKTSDKVGIHETNIPFIFTLLKQGHMRWLGQKVRIDDG